MDSELTKAPPIDELQLQAKGSAVSKLSNKDKKRLETIYDDISSTEEKLKIIEEKMANLDYTKLADPKNQELKILTDAQKVLEERLMAFYEELEDLESRNN
jgi:hypothetical protein